MDLVVALQAAVDHHQAGRLAEAEALYRQVLQAAPDHAQALHNLGALANQSGRPQLALPLLQAALQRRGQHPGYWLTLAQCRYLLGEWEEAEATLERASALGLRHPGYAELQAAMHGPEGGSKVFCIGMNKTGTTSLEAALTSLGYRLGLQARGEMLLRDWGRRDFRRIIDLCRTADAFQDSPFSRPDTFQAVDAAFPGSKFILSVRTSPDEWFQSLTRFLSKLIDKGRLPTADDLRACEYRYKGYLWEAAQLNGIDERTLYDRNLYIARYLTHNQSVMDYFRARPADLLMLNVAEPDAMQRLCAFLGRPWGGQAMPYLNRSRRPEETPEER